MDMQKLTAVALIGVALAGSLLAGQPTGGDYVLIKNTIDGGGGSSAGGDFELTGTIGQPDAASQTASGNEFALAGGFWAQIGNLVIELIFEDGFE
jgi:hypothetical protein